MRISPLPDFRGFFTKTFDNFQFNEKTSETWRMIVQKLGKWKNGRKCVRWFSLHWWVHGISTILTKSYYLPIFMYLYVRLRVPASFAYEIYYAGIVWLYRSLICSLVLQFDFLPSSYEIVKKSRPILPSKTSKPIVYNAAFRIYIFELKLSMDGNTERGKKARKKKRKKRKTWERIVCR